MKSIWESTAELPSFPKIQKDYDTDVLIIGGGLCGILCAYELQKRGINYMLAEADKICKKTTANTTAKISSLHGVIYSKLIKDFGREKALLYYQANEEAIREYEMLCKDIDCDFKKTSAYAFTQNNKERILKEYSAMCDLGIDVTLEHSLNIPVDTLCGIRLDNQAEFNPLKLISVISRDLNIYESSRVSELIGTVAIVNGHIINAKRIIVATHFPFLNKHGLYFLKMYQHRSYAIAIKTAIKIDGIYIDDTEEGLSLRSYGEYVIIVGQGHRTGKGSLGWKGLEDIARKYFPGNKVVYRWATQDCMTLDGVPYIGEYSKGTDNLYVATGFNKWGITSSMIASKLLCDLLTGKENKYKELFNPSRSILKRQLAVNLWESLVGFFTFNKKRCPHLGCKLKWNKQEHTWDCPCHGSRFSKGGHLLDGPANKDLNN